MELTAVKERVQSTASGLWSKRPGFLRGRNLLITGGAAVVLLGGWMLFGPKDDAEPYRTAAVDRGAITRVVSATGTLQPLVSANVGSTVSGPVQSVSVDFNSQVRAGRSSRGLIRRPFSSALRKRRRNWRKRRRRRRSRIRITRVISSCSSAALLLNN
jgi:multidrug efflux pump subunit AcrA (membrane-fusion protein)